MQDTDRGNTVDWQDIIRPFQMALSIFDQGNKTLTKAAQRDGRCPIHGKILSQVGCGSEQPGLLEGVCGTK